MIKVLPRNILRFFILIFAQIFIFDNMQISMFINPYIYVLFILLLPFETPGWLTLIIAFFLGFTIDVFSDTIGIHTSATLFMGFLRPYILKFISPRDGYEPGVYPRIAYFGPAWFANYTIILVFAHHFFLFFVEAFKFSMFFDTLLRVILSTIVTSIILFFSQYVVFRR